MIVPLGGAPLCGSKSDVLGGVFPVNDVYWYLMNAYNPYRVVLACGKQNWDVCNHLKVFKHVADLTTIQPRAYPVVKHRIVSVQ